MLFSAVSSEWQIDIRFWFLARMNITLERNGPLPQENDVPLTIHGKKGTMYVCEIHVNAILCCDSSEWQVSASGFSIARLPWRDWCALPVSICSSISLSSCGGLLFSFWKSFSSLTANADSLWYDRYAWIVGFLNFFTRRILKIPTDRPTKVCEKTVRF